jgi:imidazolonepropionase-like amidohydrolase
MKFRYFVLVLIFPATLPAQESLRPRLFAIRDARVVAAPGRVLPTATVVIRDGRVEAVGPNVAVPPGAAVIDGAKLTVYPGLIDGLSHAGFDFAQRRSQGGPPAPDDLASEALAATKADNRKGLTPEFAVTSALKDDDQATHWRQTGFTVRLAAPDGGLVSGQSALVSLSGLASRDTVVRTPVALHVSLRESPGEGYPRSLMGDVAHVRQFFLDAGHYHRRHAAFEQSGGAGRRPPHDAALEAAGLALARKLPVVFDADTTDAIHRALDFAEEFKLRPIIAGGRDAWKVAPRLKAQRVPVILRVAVSEPNPDRERNWPDRVKDQKRKDEHAEATCAHVLYKTGVPFALSAAGQAGDRPWDKFRENVRKSISSGLPPDAALAALTTVSAEVFGAERQLGVIEAGRPANLVVTDGNLFDAATQVHTVFADGVRFDFDVKPSADPKKQPPVDPKTPASDQKKADAPGSPVAERDSELVEDRKPATKLGPVFVIKNATVFTIANGTLANADVWVKGGKITHAGAPLTEPYPASVIDATGMFVIPGIVDTHAHYGIEGGVNEFSYSIVPEVRVRDVINSEDVATYRALAGGVTTARLLHGSANCVGGQDAVIKLKYGTSAKEMLLADAPRGVKFALGENVKRADGRFPNTRMGVEAVYIRAFSEAQAYRKQWEEYERVHSSDPNTPEPRRDLRLEALADILKGDLRIHCHCYRSDEILMLLRVADTFGFKIRSLQHVLEGYKVAPEIAAHGASCSLFSDWWAYKVEAYDAIPFAAALLNKAGVSVCLKSDSHELARHLYQEAAKCVKYGGMSQDDALKTITLNPAKQLGLEKRLGSIEVGKDADFAIFNGHPLNGYSRCEMAIIDGQVFFQRSEKLTPFQPAKAEPAKPLAKLFSSIKDETLAGNGNFILQGVWLHVFDGKPVRKADVMIERGKMSIIEEREGERLKPLRFDKDWQGTTVSHSDGFHLYPGTIDAGTVLGLVEIDGARETKDYLEGGDFQPDLRAGTAINPDSELIPVTRANGITTVLTRPMGGVLAGQSALINLAGWTPKEMTIADPFALHIDFPEENPLFPWNPYTPFVGRSIAKKQREEKIRRVKDLFRQAKDYAAGRAASPEAPMNPRLEALVPYARGEKPIIVHAMKYEAIREALQLADDMKWKIILSGAADAWKVAADLKKRDIPVIVGPVMTLPHEPHDPYDSPFACAAKLHKAGVRFCIRSSGASNARNLPYEAAMAVSYGLPPDEGLKAVTLYPAQILGVANEFGSIEAGKRANLVLTNGDILQPSTQVLAVFVNGKPYAPESKQTRLYERYLQRLGEKK